MKNATLSVLLMLGLGMTGAPVAAAQADEPEGGEAPSEDARQAPADEAAPEPAPVEGAGVEGSDPSAEAGEADPAEGAEEAPVEEAADLPPVEEAPVEATTDLATPEEEAPAEEAAEEAAEAPAEEAAAPPEPPPWRNTFFNYTNQVNTNTFWRGAQLSWNPTWQMLFSIVPRWYPGTGGFLRANFGFSLEVTDADANALNREPLLNDLSVDYVHPVVLGEGFILMPMARVVLPISRASLAAQRYFQLAGQLTLIKIIPEAGNMTIAALGRYAHWSSGSNVVQVGEPQPDRCPPSAIVNDPSDPSAVEPIALTCDQLGTASSSEHVFLAGVSLTMTPIGAFSINASAFLFITYGYPLADAVLTDQVLTSERPLIIPDQSRTHWRNFTFFSLSVAYQFLPWLNLSLGIQNSPVVAPAYDPSGNLYNPLFTPNTQVFLTATFTVDELYNELFGAQSEELTPEERQRRQ